MPTNSVRDVPTDIAKNFSINVQKMETPSDSSQSISKAGQRSPGKSNTIIKYQEVSEEVFVEDEYQISTEPLIKRVNKLGLVRTYLT